MTELCEHVMDWHRRAPPVSLRRWCATIRFSRAPCYAWRHRQRHQAPGRPPRGYSVTQNGQKIADGQIMDWITDILTTENAAYGYHKIPGVLRRRYSSTDSCQNGCIASFDSGPDYGLSENAASGIRAGWRGTASSRLPTSSGKRT